MRPDMGKVITERPRRGMRYKAPKGEKKAAAANLGEDAPKSEKIRQKWLRCWNGKEFTDVLGPIKGFLTKNCGRPWDKVCSEINAVLPATGGVSYSHARDHLFQMVETNTQKIDGVLCDSKGLPIRTWVDFYVDEHGILRKAKKQSYRWRKTKPKVFPKTEDGEWLIEDDQGRWWACSMAPYDSNGSKPHPLAEKYSFLRTKPLPTYPVVYDVFLKRTITRPSDLGFYEPLYTPKFYCFWKRQLGKREIKKYGLRS